MSKLVITGGRKIKGTLSVDGSKMLSCLYLLLQY